MQNLISGKQILEQTNITLGTLISYMKQGLQAQTEFGDQVYNIDDDVNGPPVAERSEANRRYTLNEMRKSRGQSTKSDMSKYPVGWKGYHLTMPESEEKQQELKATIEELYFEMGDFAKLHDTPDFDDDVFNELNRHARIKAEKEKLEKRESLTDTEDNRLDACQPVMDAIIAWVNGETESPAAMDHLFPTGSRFQSVRFNYVTELEQKSEDQHANLDQPHDSQRAFIFSGDYFKVVFDGKETILDDSKGLRYVLETLKNPGKVVKYVEIDRIVNGEDQSDVEEYNPYQSMTAEQLNEEHLTTDDEQASYDRATAEKVLKQIDKIYQSGEDCEEVIRNFKQESGWRVKREKNCLELGGVIKRPSKNYERIRKKISEGKGCFLKKLGESFPELHNHLSTHLWAEKGLKYNQSENQPTWYIQD